MIRRLFPAMLAALALAACSPVVTTPPTTGSGVVASAPVATAVAGKVQLEGKRALILASNTYQAAGAIVVPLIKADRLTSAQVDRVEALNRQATRLLSGADAGLSLADRAAGIFTIADELFRFAGR